MAAIVAVYSMKGGVGKSSLAVNLAEGWARAGARSLLWDVDAQGAASFLLGQPASHTRAGQIFSRYVAPAEVVEPTAHAGLDLIAADLSLRHLDVALAEADKPKRLKKLLGALAGDYDRIVLDCPPGLGELSEQLFRAADLLVVPLVPSPLSVRTLEQVREALVARGKKAPGLLPVFSMVDRRKALHREMLDAHPDWPAIPQASVVEQMGIHRAPLASFAAKSPAAAAIANVQARADLLLDSAKWLGRGEG